MKKTYKLWYILLSVLVLVFVFAFTFVNVFYYGSVVQINVPILSLIIVFPLFVGFRSKDYSKRVAVFCSGVLGLVVLVTIILYPNYTYNQALDIIKDRDQPLQLQIKRTSQDPNFFYKGHYRIETDAGTYVFNIHTGHYQLLNGD